MSDLIETVAAREAAPMGPAFRPSLLMALRYISAWASTEVLMAILHDEALLSALEQGITATELCARLGARDPRPAQGLLDALANDGILTQIGEHYRLAADAAELRAVGGWFELLIGGYRELFQGVGTLLREGQESVVRDHLRVAVGSCQISAYDAVPVTLRLLERVGSPTSTVMDYGCGDALYLVTLCSRQPGLRAIGVETTAATVAQARANVIAAGLGDRIAIEQGAAPDYEPDEHVDFLLFAFVLHEVLGRRGVDGMVAFLTTVKRRCPTARILAIEVADPYLEGRRDLLSGDPQGKGYYNWYIWLHEVSNQRLVRRADWVELFARAGYAPIAEEEVDPLVDATGLEYGVVFAPSPAGD